MIASTLILPSEKPYRLIDIKRALLTYDKVFIVSPGQRDVIPPSMHIELNTGILGGIDLYDPEEGHEAQMFHMGFDSSVRALGKTDGYDRSFDQLYEQCQLLLKEEILEVIEKPEYERHPTIVGNLPIAYDDPSPREVYEYYRTFASDQEFVNQISEGIVDLQQNSRDNDMLAPRGADDNFMAEFFLPAAASYTGPMSPEEEPTLSRMRHARIGNLCKNLVRCHYKGWVPFFTDVGYRSAVQVMERKYQEVVEHHLNKIPELQNLKLLSRLENVIFTEYIEDDIVDKLSLQEVLRMRTVAWGKDREARNDLIKLLRRIAQENPEEAKFNAQCRKYIDEYQSKRIDAQGQATNSIVKATLAVLTANLATEVDSDLIQNILPTQNFSELLLLAARGITSLDLSKLLTMEKKYEVSEGYTLYKPYTHIKALK